MMHRTDVHSFAGLAEDWVTGSHCHLMGWARIFVFFTDCIMSSFGAVVNWIFVHSLSISLDYWS